MEQSENYTSYKSILKVTLPLILVSLSSYLMMSINRIVLASISADMMNAVIMSVTFINIFNNFFNDIIEKNCIFISQYYGNKQNDKVATCVWQMIFFSIFLIPVSLGMSFLSEKLHNLPENLLVYGIPYQRLMFSCSFLYFIYTALVTFFISQGKTYIISLSVILGCLINVISSVIFVNNLNFGTSGTAYGNILGTLSQIVFLSFLFFDKKNNEVFKTRTISWDFTLLKKISKLGLPIGLFNSISTIS